MIEYTHDALYGLWYFDIEPGKVHRTQSLENVTVNIDWSEGGRVLGIEVIE